MNAGLASAFDAVIMLTWSDWKTEPRSNRFHYATRFARQLPVLFVQPWSEPDVALRVEPSDTPGIDIVHATWKFEATQVTEFRELLRHRGIRRPLFWIYNCTHYGDLLTDHPNAFRVYHATEDYFTPSLGWNLNQQSVAAALKTLLQSVDLVIGVSQGVIDAYRTLGGYRGHAILVENGCDAEFFLGLRDDLKGQLEPGEPVAIFQGGINKRLDFALLHRLIHLLPTWQFWFCGAADEKDRDWKLLASHPNVRHFGALAPEQFGALMCRATVGLIPFEQSEWIGNSLPLKAFEYVACGLPVVTVPIKALRRFGDLFVEAHDAEAFAHAMTASIARRNDPAALARRHDAALENGYDKHFARVEQALLDGATRLRARPRRLNIVVLYDDAWTHISTIEEHLAAFQRYSRHAVWFLPGTSYVGGNVRPDFQPGTNIFSFDVVIVHFSVRLSLRDHLMEALARQLERFRGLKVLFIQDEYENTETARRWMDRLRFDIVYTCVPADYREVVYPSHRFPTTEFLPTLTGYVPEDPTLDQYALPLEDRRTLIGYRGRMLPFIYGTLGWEKYRIGVDVAAHALQRGLKVDIEVDDAKRIYGTDWYRFLGSARATLGTESGSNVFDFDGSTRDAIDAVRSAKPDISFDEVHARILAPHEGRVVMNQISPKIFEAIRLRTALVLFEGKYSDVVRPWQHYIPLAKDYSNIDEVFAKLEDDGFIEALTQRAYDEIIAAGRYSYKAFIDGVDSDLAERALRAPRFRLYATPVVARAGDGAAIPLAPATSVGYALSTGILGSNLQRLDLAAMLDTAGRNASSESLTPPAAPLAVRNEQPGAVIVTAPMFVPRRSPGYRWAHAAWRMLPVPVRRALRGQLIRFAGRGQRAENEKGLAFRVLRPFWRVVPAALRGRILTVLRGG